VPPVLTVAKAMSKKTFAEYIRELRVNGKILMVWNIRGIHPLLQPMFPESTISVYPNNCSTTPDGQIRGDSVKRGVAPQFLRVGRGLFILAEEYETWKSTIAHDGTGTTLATRRVPMLGTDFLKRPIGEVGPRYRKRPDSIQGRLLEAFPSKAILMEYAGICDREYRPSSSSCSLYRQIIDAHAHKQPSELIGDIGFIKLIYRTLVFWDMDYRAARLVPFGEFINAIKAASPGMVELAPYRLCHARGDVLNRLRIQLETLFQSLRVMQSRSQIVGFSKTLHFFLPQLVMPIDGKYTLSFLFGYRKWAPSLASEARLLGDIFSAFGELASQLGLFDEDRLGKGWNATAPKIIDNAIIGFMMSNGKQMPTGARR
jgi:hypothetical protein